MWTTKKQEFLKEYQGYDFGDVINGVTGDTAEDILDRVKHNPQSTNPDQGFFFAVPDGEQPTWENTIYFSIADILKILEIKLETVQK